MPLPAKTAVKAVLVQHILALPSNKHSESALTKLTKDALWAMINGSVSEAVQKTPAKRKRPPIAQDADSKRERQMMASEIKRIAGEELKSFSRSKRYLRDIEVDMCAKKVLAASRGVYMFPITTIREFLWMFESLDSNQVDTFLAITGHDTRLIQHAVVILNMYDPLLAADDENQEDLHFVMLVFDIANKKAMLFDPLDVADGQVHCDEPAVHMIVNTLKQKFDEFGFDGYTVHSRCLNVQLDDYNCGIWCLSMLELYSSGGCRLDAINVAALESLNIKDQRIKFSRMLYGQ